MSIRDVHISAYGDGNTMHEPPERILNLAVIGGIAHVQVQEMGETGETGDIQAKIEVPAKSLLRALQGAIEDDEDDIPKR